MRIKIFHFGIEIHLPYLKNNSFLNLRKEWKQWSWQFKLSPTISVWKETKAEASSSQGRFPLPLPQRTLFFNSLLAECRIHASVSSMSASRRQLPCGLSLQQTTDVNSLLPRQVLSYCPVLVSWYFARCQGICLHWYHSMKWNVLERSSIELWKHLWKGGPKTWILQFSLAFLILGSKDPNFDSWLPGGGWGDNYNCLAYL